MNKIFFLIITIGILACKETKKFTPEIQYVSFGDNINIENTIDGSNLLQKYKTLKEGDTIEVKVKGIIKDVCQKKGCWVTLQLQDSLETFVKFKDYSFFMPLNASGSSAILNGKAFVARETVESLKHYAKDEGKSQAEIDAITKPEVTYSFLADGVLLEKSKK
jgi:hypothetical protein